MKSTVCRENNSYLVIMFDKLDGLFRSRERRAQGGLRMREGTLCGLWVGGKKNIQEDPRGAKPGGRKTSLLC